MYMCIKGTVVFSFDSILLQEKGKIRKRSQM